MRVDKLKKWTDFRDEVVAISRAIAAAQSQPTPMDIGAVGKEKSCKGGKGSQGAGKRNNPTQQACPRCGNTDHTSANCPHSDKKVPTMWEGWSFGMCVSIFWNSSAQGQGPSFGHSHHAREETLCLVPESQAQASQRVPVHRK